MAILGYSIKVHDKALKTVFPFSVLFGFFFFFIFYFLFFLLIFSKIKWSEPKLRYIFSNCIIKLKIEEIIDRQAEREKEKRSGITSNKG